MAKKNRKRSKEEPEALDVEAASISYTDYNTIMSIQLLIDKLNAIVGGQVSLRRQMNELREEVSEARKELAAISKYLMVPGDMNDGNEDGEKEEASGTSEPDTPSGEDE